MSINAQLIIEAIMQLVKMSRQLIEHCCGVEDLTI